MKVRQLVEALLECDQDYDVLALSSFNGEFEVLAGENEVTAVEVHNPLKGSPYVRLDAR